MKPAGHGSAALPAPSRVATRTRPAAGSGPQPPRAGQQRAERAPGTGSGRSAARTATRCRRTGCCSAAHQPGCGTGMRPPAGLQHTARGSTRCALRAPPAGPAATHAAPRWHAPCWHWHGMPAACAQRQCAHTHTSVNARTHLRVCRREPFAVGPCRTGVAPVGGDGAGLARESQGFLPCPAPEPGPAPHRPAPLGLSPSALRLPWDPGSLGCRSWPRNSCSGTRRVARTPRSPSTGVASHELRDETWLPYRLLSEHSRLPAPGP